MVERRTIAVITFNDVPAVNHTRKYNVLGRLAVENRRLYCRRHGYTFIDNVPIARDRPACWAKIPAILAAFETHDWVLWADSDTLVLNPAQPLEHFCRPDHDLVVQAHDRYYQALGIPIAQGWRRMPINTGVFLIRATSWSRGFLADAYHRTEFITHTDVWDGIGEQEAMIALLHEHQQDLRRIAYVEDLQAPPKFYRPGCLFMHFYGNHVRKRLPDSVCEAVVARWTARVLAEQGPLADAACFHWACIQNHDPDRSVAGGNLERYLYREADILPAPD
jgi:hypothetical protein